MPSPVRSQNAAMRVDVWYDVVLVMSSYEADDAWSELAVGLALAMLAEVLAYALPP